MWHCLLSVPTVLVCVSVSLSFATINLQYCTVSITKRQYETPLHIMGSCTSCLTNAIEISEQLDHLINNDGNGNGGFNGHKEQVTSLQLQSPATCIYPNLPSEYEQHFVTKVYDGDTITLRSNDGNRPPRLRLISIDTPEINEKQPFAEEAKQYTHDKCYNKDIYLSYEPGGDKTDRYNRLIAWIWVTVKDKKGKSIGYLNVNEALIAHGLASFYNPSSKTKLQNHDKMLSLQKRARENRRGMWIDFQDGVAIKTRNGRCYHRSRDCKFLKRSKNVLTVRISEALDCGLSPCRGCHE